MIGSGLRGSKDLLARKKEQENRQKAHAAQTDKGIIKMVDDLVSKAVSMKATDLHLESIFEGPRVRVRLENGSLEEIAKPDPGNYTNLVNRFKVLSNMDITNFRTPL